MTSSPSSRYTQSTMFLLGSGTALAAHVVSATPTPTPLLNQNNTNNNNLTSPIWGPPVSEPEDGAWRLAAGGTSILILLSVVVALFFVLRRRSGPARNSVRGFGKMNLDKTVVMDCEMTTTMDFGAKYEPPAAPVVNKTSTSKQQNTHQNGVPTMQLQRKKSVGSSADSSSSSPKKQMNNNNTAAASAAPSYPEDIIVLNVDEISPRHSPTAQCSPRQGSPAAVVDVDTILGVPPPATSSSPADGSRGSRASSVINEIDI
eukprot:PhM_4_TR2874/c0_g1_i1/m.55028